MVAKFCGGIKVNTELKAVANRDAEALAYIISVNQVLVEELKVKSHMTPFELFAFVIPLDILL